MSNHPMTATIIALAMFAIAGWMPVQAIAGERLSNGSQNEAPPSQLPGGGSQTGLRSNTSPGGGTGNAPPLDCSDQNHPDCPQGGSGDKTPDAIARNIPG